MSARRLPKAFQLTAVVFAAALIVADVSWAQQRYPIEEKPEWSTGKYLQQHAIEVGDVPGHKVRVLELHYIYNDQSEFAVSDVKVKEGWSRGFSDYTNGKRKVLGIRDLAARQWKQSVPRQGQPWPVRQPPVP